MTLRYVRGEDWPPDLEWRNKFALIIFDICREEHADSPIRYLADDFLTWHEDDEVRGFLGGTPADIDTFRLDHFWLRPAHRSRETAERMWTEFKAWLIAQGYRRCITAVDKRRSLVVQHFERYTPFRRYAETDRMVWFSCNL